MIDHDEWWNATSETGVDKEQEADRRSMIRHQDLMTGSGMNYDGISEMPTMWDGEIAEYRLDGAYPTNSDLIRELKSSSQWQYMPAPYYQWYGRGLSIKTGSTVLVGGIRVGVHRHDETQSWSSVGECQDEEMQGEHEFVVWG